MKHIAEYRLWSSHGLNNRQERFLREWQLPRRGLFLPVDGGNDGLYVWGGRTFADGETVTIVTGLKTKPNLPSAHFFVGLVREEIVEEASVVGTPLDAYAEAAVHEVIGKASAIYALNELKGIPNGDRLALDIPVDI